MVDRCAEFLDPDVGPELLMLRFLLFVHKNVVNAFLFMFFLLSDDDFPAAVNHDAVDIFFLLCR